jgi:uracil DNA glycosylase
MVIHIGADNDSSSAHAKITWQKMGAYVGTTFSHKAKTNLIFMITGAANRNKSSTDIRAEVKIMSSKIPLSHFAKDLTICGL